jgi:lysophospholipid acyltransferase (LPLAT)-like uncharacterized protein
MAKKFSNFTFWLIKTAGIFVIKVLRITWRYKQITSSPQQRVIYAFWHRNILPLMMLHKDENLVVMISQSQDGQLIADVCRALGYLTVRGSSRRGGSRAVRDMIRIAKTNSLGITPDGPKGPAKEFKEGLVFVAKATGLPIVLVAVQVKNEKVFNSWDRFRLPLLFSRINVIYDEPLYVDRKQDSNQVINLLSKRMNNLENRIEKHDIKGGCHERQEK